MSIATGGARSEDPDPAILGHSLARGIAFAGWCMERAKEVFALQVVVVVVAVEVCPAARALAARMGGAVSRQHDLQNVQSWVQDPGRCHAFV